MNKDGKKKGGEDKGEVDVGGIMVRIGEENDVNTPLPKDLENELREGGIEVVEGKKSPEEEFPVS